MPIQRVALVGHCGFDAGSLSRLAGQIAPQAEVVRVNDQETLDTMTGPGTLLLVNRALDGRFDAETGIDLIRVCRSREDAPAAMLVSNYADAQQQAVEAGALPGFGKSQVGDRATTQRLADVIASLKTTID